MKQSLFERLRVKVRGLISKVTKHEHSCCDNIFKNCNNCKGVE